MSIQDSLRNRLPARVLTPAATAVVVLAALFLVACDPGEPVVVENTTTQILLVFEGDIFIDAVAPRSVRRFIVGRNFRGSLTYQVKSLDLEVLDSVTFTSKEIRESDGITITVE